MPETSRDIDISVVVPLYNEEQSLAGLTAEIAEVMSGLGRSWELIFINDGSLDGSSSVLEGIHSQSVPGAEVRIIEFRTNYGKSAALAVGFESSRGDIIITMDADLQDDPHEIPKLLDKLAEGHDLVSGWKLDRQDPLFRRLASRLFNLAARLISRVPLHDFNCGFKVYRREVVEGLRLYGELHRYLPVLARWRGFGSTEVRVSHRARRFGRSKFGPSRYLRGFFDLLTVYFLTRFTRRPLHLFGGMGLISFLAGLVINVYLTVLWFGGQGIGRRPLLFLGILLLIVGVQMISIGLLGEMLAHQSSHIDEYSIKRVLG